MGFTYLTVIISVYCIMRLLWNIGQAIAGPQNKPNLVYTILSVVAIVIIVIMCLQIIGLTIMGSNQSWLMPYPAG